MQPVARRRPWLRWLALAALLAVIAVGIFGGWLAGQAGMLPWQEDPTRVATGITPFAGLDLPAFGAASPTPGSGS